ncbi:MAG: 50S ribosomal protein L25/general stress protein Ctc [Gammaproteobacteria bacterium]|jgi:large subunit ribosomal protein L25
MTVARFELTATKRVATGKLASRRMRLKQNQVPAVLYGGKEASLSIHLDHNKLLQVSAHEKFYSQILTLTIDGHKQKAVLKDLQRHPFKPKILHLDFQRVKETDVLTMQVPLHFIGLEKCPGVKLGGVVSHNANYVEVRCQAQFLPEFIEVDLSLLELGQIIHLSDLKLPNSVEIPALIAYQKGGDKGLNAPIASVQIIKEVVIEETVAAVATTLPEEKDVKDKKDSKDGKDSKDSNKDKAKSAPSSDKKDKK